jgi:hypothetical protein
LDEEKTLTRRLSASVVLGRAREDFRFHGHFAGKGLRFTPTALFKREDPRPRPVTEGTRSPTLLSRLRSHA